MTTGRPRSFDADATLDRVVEVFWRQGYEGTSLAELTAATGLNKPSLYAAFGNKENLFQLALERYLSRLAQETADLLEASPARAAVEQLLLALAERQTLPEMPHGCLQVHGNLVGGADSSGVRDGLKARRAQTEDKIQRRLLRARKEGELPADCNVADLARYFATVIQGVAVQAASGATRPALQRVIAMAMKAWPAA